MKNLILLLLTLLVLSCFGQDVSLGLKFTPPEQLQGIPLASTPYSGDELPNSIDLSSKMPPAGNQGRQSSCVGWAVAYACKSYQEKIEENFNYVSGGTINTEAVFSPAYIYNQINNGVDGGSLFTDALNIVSQKGAVKWKDMPYSETDYLTRPNLQQHDRAKKYRIDFWRRVNYFDIKEVKAQLNAGYPVIIGAVVDRGFVEGGRNTAGRDYFWNSVNGQQLGGHAMLVVGYDDSKGAFKVINSWGRNWGNDGYFWFTYQLFPQVVREGYVMKDAINSPDDNPRPNPVPSPTNDLNASFQLTSVKHNIQDMQCGLVMRFDGYVNVPQGIGKTVQIVVKFYLNDGRNGKGMPVGGLSTYFMMPDGMAACGTPKSNIIPGNQSWFASMPYIFLNIPRGGPFQPRTTYLIAEPTLYIDDFAVQIGQLIPFFVNL